MPGGVDSTGLAVGLKKGFLVEKRVMKVKPSQRRKEGKHVAFVRGIIREIAGYSPLERRGMELLKNGRDKRVLKLCKKRVRAPTNSLQGDMGCGQLFGDWRARRESDSLVAKHGEAYALSQDMASRLCGNTHCGAARAEQLIARFVGRGYIPETS